MLTLSNAFSIAPFQDKDAELLVHHLAKKEIYDATITIPYPYGEKDAKLYLYTHRDLREEFSIRNTKDELVGCIGFRFDPNQSHKAILGYWLAKEYWGKGIMTEAVRSFCRDIMERNKFARITASCFEHNIGSARVLEKAGFKFEGLMIKHYQKDGDIFNGKLYALTKE